jgi:hypothetical protein
MKPFCAIAMLVVVLVACSRRSGEIEEIVLGGLYASKSEDGTFRVAKVLAVDDVAVHVRIYKNRFNTLPQNLDTSALSLGGLGDPEGFGIGHAPLAKKGWLNSRVFLKKEPVKDEELEGYRYYLEERQKR